MNELAGGRDVFILKIESAESVSPRQASRMKRQPQSSARFVGDRFGCPGEQAPALKISPDLKSSFHSQ
jgi:hypothetical protein